MKSAGGNSSESVSSETGKDANLFHCDNIIGLFDTLRESIPHCVGHVDKLLEEVHEQQEAMEVIEDKATKRKMAKEIRSKKRTIEKLEQIPIMFSDENRTTALKKAAQRGPGELILGDEVEVDMGGNFSPDYRDVLHPAVVLNRGVRSVHCELLGFDSNASIVLRRRTEIFPVRTGEPSMWDRWTTGRRVHVLMRNRRGDDGQLLDGFVAEKGVWVRAIVKHRTPGRITVMIPDWNTLDGFKELIVFERDSIRRA